MADLVVPRKHGQRWSMTDDERLRDALARHDPIKDIAALLERRQDAVRGRAWALGLTLGSSLRRWRRGRVRR